MSWANVFFLGAKFNLKYLVPYLGTDDLKKKFRLRSSVKRKRIMLGKCEYHHGVDWEKYWFSGIWTWISQPLRKPHSTSMPFWYDCPGSVGCSVWNWALCHSLMSQFRTHWTQEEEMYLWRVKNPLIFSLSWLMPFLFRVILLKNWFSVLSKEYFPKVCIPKCSLIDATNYRARFHMLSESKMIYISGESWNPSHWFLSSPHFLFLHINVF